MQVKPGYVVELQFEPDGEVIRGIVNEVEPSDDFPDDREQDLVTLVGDDDYAHPVRYIVWARS
jgi:hypothetical protein